MQNSLEDYLSQALLCDTRASACPEGEARKFYTTAAIAWRRMASSLERGQEFRRYVDKLRERQI